MIKFNNNILMINIQNHQYCQKYKKINYLIIQTNNHNKEDYSK